MPPPGKVSTDFRLVGRSHLLQNGQHDDSKGGTVMPAALETEKQDTAPNWKHIMQELGPAFAARADEYDGQNRFVAANFEELRKFRLFSAMVPMELGGGGLPYGEMSLLIQEIGRVCGSTALAFAMHQHLVAAAVFNY